MLPTLIDARRVVLLRRRLQRYGFSLVVGRFQPFVGDYRASIFDASGEYCAGVTASDLHALVNRLEQVVDGLRLWK